MSQQKKNEHIQDSYNDILLHTSALDGVTIFSEWLVIIKVVVSVFRIMASFVFQVVVTVISGLVIGFGRLFVNAVYFIMWIFFHFSCGILGLGDRSTSAFSWLCLVFMLFLYCDRNYHDNIVKFSRLFSSYLRRRHPRWVYGYNYVQYNEVMLENQRNEHREIEPISRQLEAENRENENEENNLVEAYRHRMENDNRTNIARENGVDNHRARIENHQNVERERHNTRTSLDNRRNRTQEQHRYFLRYRNRCHHLQQNRLGIAQRGIGAVVLPGQHALYMLQPGRNISIGGPDVRHDTASHSQADGGERVLHMRDRNGHMEGMQDSNNNQFGRTRQGFPNRDGGSMPRQ